MNIITGVLVGILIIGFWIFIGLQVLIDEIKLIRYHCDAIRIILEKLEV